MGVDVPPGYSSMGILKSVFPGDEVEVVFECRTCGTTLDDYNATCPYCDVTEIVRYEIT